MISRVAEKCFWLLRYMERVEHTSRMVGEHHALTLNINSPGLEQWLPLVLAIGEEQRFKELYPNLATEEQGEAVQKYLIWEEANPVSVYTSLNWARENGRIIRDILSIELWEALNTFWIWLDGKASTRLYYRDRFKFYQEIKTNCHLFRGMLENTILQDEAYHFMRLGMMLERTSQIARILDVNYELFFGDDFTISNPVVETAHWLSLLRSCSAKQSFVRKVFKPLKGHYVMAFLLLEPTLPVSIYYCLERARYSLEMIQTTCRLKQPIPPQQELLALYDYISKIKPNAISPRQSHEILTYVVEQITHICQTIHETFFDFSEAIQTQTQSQSQSQTQTQTQSFESGQIQISGRS